MADLIPPVPFKKFEHPQEISGWWDWFRRMRDNVNTFAADITGIIADLTQTQSDLQDAVDDINDIVTQIATNNDSSSAGIGSTGFTSQASITVSDISESSLTVSGVYPVWVTGRCEIKIDATTTTLDQVDFVFRIYENSTVGQSTILLTKTFLSDASTKTVDVIFPVNYVFESPNNGSNDYSYEIIGTFYDSTPTGLNTTGAYSVTSYLFAKEMKT